MAIKATETDWLQVFHSSFDGRWYWNRRAKDWKVVKAAARSYRDRDEAMRDARKINPGIEVREPGARRNRAAVSAKDSLI